MGVYSNLQVAEKEARRIDDLLQRREYGLLEDGHNNQRTTFAGLMEEFRANYTNWGPETWRSTGSTLKKLDQEFGALLLTAITSRRIETYIARRRDQDGVTDSTNNRYLAVLKTMFKMALRWGYLGHNPAAGIRAVKEQGKIPEALTDDPLEQLLVALPERIRLIVTIAADTGMRKGELRRLRWDDVVLAERSIRVQESKNYAFRVIPMTHRVYGILVGLWNERTGEKVRNIQVLPFVDIKISLHKAGINTGIGHVHMHMLRHTFATRLRDRGCRWIGLKNY